MKNKHITILGVFVADTAFRADRMPKMGETLIGMDFKLGPGGKGSNQAVAVARLGAPVSFISKLGKDEFAKMALSTWESEGVTPRILEDKDSFTGAAFIYVDDKLGDNAIIVVPGAAQTITPDDMENYRKEIANSSIFMTQIETPLDASVKGLAIAKESGVITILNPAPAVPLTRDVLELCDYLTPNESEAEILTGMEVKNVNDAMEATEKLRSMGGNRIIITLGERGAFYNDGEISEHVPAKSIGKVVETTGAGDSFCGAFAYALLNDMDPVNSTRFACTAASISVTRPGTAPAMPTLEEVKQHL
ncbi:MAG: ribokinase [Rhodobacteraceae bacterium]|nr:ribokinase [Paracoccaceae bacterium]